MSTKLFAVATSQLKKVNTKKAFQILNHNGFKFTYQQADQILRFLYQLGEIAYLQFNQNKPTHEKGSIVHQGFYRRAS